MLRVNFTPDDVARVLSAPTELAVWLFGPPVAAVQEDPQHARGLDAELAMLARQSWWGPALLGLVSAGLVVLAAYSAVEARYRQVAPNTVGGRV